MSNRFFTKVVLRCERCNGTERLAHGYRPIPNPMLFKSDEHCRGFHQEQRRSAGMVGMRATQHCSTCNRVHSQWKVLTNQEYLLSKGI